MRTKLNFAFKKILENVEKNLEKFVEGKPALISSELFSEVYIKDSNITTCKEHNEIFSELRQIKRKPVLYWFSIDDEITKATALRNKYLEFKDLKSLRNSSACKPYLDTNSKTLYVGKVKKDFHLRLVTHLGYSKNKDTAGMQLFHWYKPQEFGNLTLNYIVFEEEMKDLITILEIEFARELKPIIGKYSI